MKKKAVIMIAALAAFSIKVWQGFAPPVVEAGSMPMGAMNDPLAVIISGIMTAVVVWGALEVLFWFISKIAILSVHARQRKEGNK